MNMYKGDHPLQAAPLGIEVKLKVDKGAKKGKKNKPKKTAKKDVTWVVFLLDRSGSMQTIKSDVEGGFDAFMAEQVKGRGTCLASLAQFDTVYDRVYTNVPVADAPRLNLLPRGGTALCDSMVRVIHDTDEAITAAGDAAPDNVILAVVTDGMENSSVRYSRADVKKLVKERSKRGWEVLYMGANQDAVEEGETFGIDADHSITYTLSNAANLMGELSSNVVSYRAARSAGDVLSSAAFSDEQRGTLTR